MIQDYLFCTNRPWALSAFAEARPRLAGRWSVCVSPTDLAEAAERCNPRYIFFPHWSSIVPQVIVDAYECVCFHMTDVPYGRGGSPLQNLIVRRHKETKLTALRMTEMLDAGPVYLKRPLSLQGAAEDIFKRASELSVEMMAEIVETQPEPVAQTGEVTHFARRMPSQSAIPVDADPGALYDHIRMLDADGYPQAFIQHGEWVARFTDARLDGSSVEARVRFEQINSREEQ